MLKRILFFAYGSLSYLIFLGTFLYAVCFVGAFGVPRTLDGAASGPLGLSVAIDAGLPALFAVQHSVMARKWFKDWWTRIVPKPDEEFGQLVDFVRNGLLDQRAKPENLRKLIPKAVPSGFPALRFD